ncbi:MAG: hypothetical protein VX900_03380 [Pseudomonadota bacterium]|nr:hypothetical protein [Pseudomonadota bacterium]
MEYSLRRVIERGITLEDRLERFRIDRVARGQHLGDKRPRPIADIAARFIGLHQRQSAFGEHRIAHIAQHFGAVNQSAVEIENHGAHTVVLKGINFVSGRSFIGRQ